MLRSGELKSLDQPLLSFFPERTIANDSADKHAITLANALSMTSGFDCVAQPELTLTQMQSAPDWIGFALDVPMAGPPGQSFRYCSSVPHILSGVVSRSSGQPLDQLLTERLFKPLLAEPPVWPRDPQGISHGWGDARLKPEAMARFGQMLLGGGKFGDTRVLDTSYVDLATTNRDGALLPPPGYGYGIWVGGSGRAHGLVGPRERDDATAPSGAPRLVTSTCCRAAASSNMRISGRLQSRRNYGPIWLCVQQTPGKRLRSLPSKGRNTSQRAGDLSAVA